MWGWGAVASPGKGDAEKTRFSTGLKGILSNVRDRRYLRLIVDHILTNKNLNYPAPSSIQNQHQQTFLETMPVAIVTGSSGGIGRGIALRLADDGFDVVVNDTAPKQANIDAVVAEINAKGKNTVGIAADVSNKEQVQALVPGAVEKFGALNVMVANAGILETTPLLELSVEQWDRSMAIFGECFCAFKLLHFSSSTKAEVAELLRLAPFLGIGHVGRLLLIVRANGVSVVLLKRLRWSLVLAGSLSIRTVLDLSRLGCHLYLLRGWLKREENRM
jgi:hypothetical protein